MMCVRGSFSCYFSHQYTTLVMNKRIEHCFTYFFLMMDASNLINLVYRNLRKMFCGNINIIYLSIIALYDFFLQGKNTWIIRFMWNMCKTVKSFICDDTALISICFRSLYIFLFVFVTLSRLVCTARLVISIFSMNIFSILMCQKSTFLISIFFFWRVNITKNNVMPPHSLYPS